MNEAFQGDNMSLCVRLHSDLSVCSYFVNEHDTVNNDRSTNWSPNYSFRINVSVIGTWRCFPWPVSHHSIIQWVAPCKFHLHPPTCWGCHPKNCLSCCYGGICNSCNADHRHLVRRKDVLLFRAPAGLPLEGDDNSIGIPSMLIGIVLLRSSKNPFNFYFLY